MGQDDELQRPRDEQAQFTLRQIEIIRAVVVTGSISDAARFLGISQPSISATLKQCEEVARFKLFRREQGRVKPTDDVLELLPSFERLVESVEEVNALAGDLRNGNAGALRIAATHAIALSLLPEAVRSFSRAHRNVRITIRTMLSTDVVDEVGSGRIDLGLVMSPYEVRGTHTIELWPSELVCVVPSGHQLSREKAVTPELLRDYPLISFSRAMPVGRLIDEAFRARGVARHIAVEIGPSIMALQLVEQGIGCAVVDPFSVSRYPRHGICILPFRPRTKLSAQIVTHAAHAPSRSAAAFIRVIKEVVSHHLK